MGEAADDLDLLVLVHLLEHVGQPLVVHRRRDRLALHEGERPQAVGEVRRMQVAQAGHLARHGPGVEERDDHRPRHGVRPAAAADRARRPEGDGGDLPPDAAGLRVDEADVVDDLVADAPVEEVLLEQQLAAASTEVAQVDRRGAQAGAAGVEALDLRGVHEDPATLDRGDEADHAGRAGEGRREDDDVGDAADGRTSEVEQRQLRQSGDVDGDGRRGLPAGRALHPVTLPIRPRTGGEPGVPCSGGERRLEGRDGAVAERLGDESLGGALAGALVLADRLVVRGDERWWAATSCRTPSSPRSPPRSG